MSTESRFNNALIGLKSIVYFLWPSSISVEHTWTQIRQNSICIQHFDLICKD